MLKLGIMQTLIIVKKVDFGVYSSEQINATIDERVLLPKKQVPEVGASEGDEMEGFSSRFI